MHLVMFDIDGTLTETMKVDEECFVRSLAEVCSFTDVETDWSTYKHATDSGIFHEIIWLAPDGLRRLPRFRVFGSTLLLCSRRRQSNLRSCPSQERDSCFSPSLAVRSIGFLLLPELGVILHVSRWPAPV